MTDIKNRFGTQKNEAETVKDRFLPENQNRVAHLVGETNEPQRKKGYKGRRKPLSLRLPVSLIEDLSFVSFATRETQQDICESVINKAVQSKIKALEKSHSEASFESLKKVFYKKA
jgi:hypothetical protein